MLAEIPVRMQNELLLRGQNETVSVVTQVQGVQQSLEDAEGVGREYDADGLVAVARLAQRCSIGSQSVAAITVEVWRQPHRRAFHGTVIPVAAGFGVILIGVKILETDAILFDHVGRSIKTDAGMVSERRESDSCLLKTGIRVNQISRDGEYLRLARPTIAKNVFGGTVHFPADAHQRSADLVSRCLGDLPGGRQGIVEQCAVLCSKLQPQDDRQQKPDNG